MSFEQGEEIKTLKSEIAALRGAAVPVGEVIAVVKEWHGTAPRTIQMIDNNFAMTWLPVGTKFYTHPAPPVAIPDGWVLVPEKPTPEMLEKMYRAASYWDADKSDTMEEAYFSFSEPKYLAALAAAPKLPFIPAPPVVVLPSRFTPMVSDLGRVTPIPVMRKKTNGSWLNASEVMIALQTAGIQFKSADSEGE